MALRWNSTLAVGVPEIDAQHQELFHRVERLLDAMIAHDASEAGRLLAFLEEYVEIHFRAEEELMRLRRYPSLAAHKAEHDLFVTGFEELKRTYAAQGATPDLVLRLERQVCVWLRNHVCVTDVALGRFLVRA